MLFNLLTLSGLVAVLAILAFVSDPWRVFTARGSEFPEDFPATFIRNWSTNRSLERIRFGVSSSQTPDTTAIILNWSRLTNVIRIVGVLCASSLENTIAEIVVWNNSPHRLTLQDFASAKCKRLKLYNSPANIFFYARFLACSRATTRYCFIQDDDYLILPEVINAVHSSMTASASEGIHVLPAHEKLSSDLRKIQVDALRHTSFAWLGHGAMITRTRAVNFLSLMGHLNASEEELKMADNYYTILGNTFVETWFDQGIELGGGKPFTVGSEGEERNRRHIVRATEMLESVLFYDDPYCSNCQPLPLYVQRDLRTSSLVNRAPCRGSNCLLETTIPILPDTISRASSHLTQILVREAENERLLGEQRKLHYLSYPPSHAVDGNTGTSFRSYGNAKQGDQILLKVFRQTVKDWRRIELAFLVDAGTEEILQAAVFRVLKGRNQVVISNRVLVCHEADIKPRESEAGYLRECAMEMLPWDVTLDEEAEGFGVMLPMDVQRQWCIYEMWLRGVRSGWVL